MVLLIADDEKMARVSLMLILKDLNLPSVTIVEATNGKNFLEKVERYKPEIAFVDIHMPIYNGLEGIEKARQISSDTVYIIVTGFSEFEFARKAIELKVDNYLLKPVEAEELGRVVSESLIKYNEKCLIQNKNYERFIIAQFYNVENLDLSGMNRDYSVSLPECQSMSFIFDSSSEELMIKAKADLFLKIRKLSRAYISRELFIAVFNTSADTLFVLCSFNMSSSQSSKNFFIECEGLDRNINEDLLISCFKTQFSYKDREQQYNSMIDLSLLRIVFRDTIRHDINYYVGNEKKEDYLKICNLVKSLCNNYIMKNQVAFMNVLERLRTDSFFQKIIENDLLRQNISGYVSLYTGINFKGSACTLQQWISELSKEGSLFSGANTSSKRYIDDVLEYIELNYMKDIGISIIAENLNITPNYLSKIFHKETNSKFTDYLTKTRISNAQKMLLESSLTIKEIAVNVGYRSTRHFTNLFVKYTGEYPSQFRKS